ncbi:hypothetical protein FB451DRAFT_1484293 [Mycena latifolia]|nr:hypothetical protein FB451DRAFT_1484293 [Mycena latifolia]
MVDASTTEDQDQAVDDVEAEGEEDVDGDWDEYEEEEEEEDLDAVAQRLQEKLWADIAKANAAEPPPAVAPDPVPTPNPKEQAAVATVRGILAFLEHDSLANSTLAGSKVPEFANDSLLDILRNIASSGKIPHGVAMPISRFLVTLANSEVLFGGLRHSDAPSLQLKRKRDEADVAERASKRLRIINHPLHKEVAEAVGVISQTVSTAQTLDPPLVTSIQPQLHRVFLFAVSSSAAGGAHANALQEISGLIQVLGVLSAIQIAQAPTTGAAETVLTAVHPCLTAGCGKFFARLYSLRAHQHVHGEERPYRCDACPAAFARAHDQKRHRQTHDRTAWKCAGCEKVFSRRDAIKRHKTPTAARRPRDECVGAQIVEVEVPGNADRAAAKSAPGPAQEDTEEEGEIAREVIEGIQEVVLGLHTLLQTHVTRALGAPAGQQVPARAVADAASNGQATLASVIARVQLSQARADAPVAIAAQPPAPAGDATSLSMYGLSDEQTKLLEEAITNAASAAQAEAEAQAALEEQDADADAAADVDADVDAEDDESDATNAQLPTTSNSTPN